MTKTNNKDGVVNKNIDYVTKRLDEEKRASKEFSTIHIPSRIKDFLKEYCNNNNTTISGFINESIGETLCNTLEKSFISDNKLSSKTMGIFFKVNSNNKHIESSLINLFTNVVDIDNNLWDWLKYIYENKGDLCLRLYVGVKDGVYKAIPLCQYKIIRIEDSDPSNEYYVKYEIELDGKKQILESYQLIELSHQSNTYGGKCKLPPFGSILKRFTQGLLKLAQIHLYAQGWRDEKDFCNFEININHHLRRLGEQAEICINNVESGSNQHMLRLQQKIGK